MKPYDLILADPPWAYDRGTRHARAEDHYPTMTLGEISRMRPLIEAFAAEDCLLAMWCTSPKMVWGADLGRAWGNQVGKFEGGS